MNLGVLLGHARVPGTPLELPGELSSRRPSLPHCGHTQMQVEFVTLQPVPDVFDYLPPGGIAAICPSSSINLRHPQCYRSSPTTNICPGSSLDEPQHGRSLVPNCRASYGCGTTPNLQLPRAKP